MNLPEDMTEVYNRISNFKVDLIIEECQKNNIDVGAVIEYLESKEDD